MRRVLFVTFLLSLGTVACAPPLMGSGAPTEAECPTDGTVFAHGSCVLPDGVVPAVPGLVKPGAPSKVCVLPPSTLFECPENYVVPEGAVPVE